MQTRRIELEGSAGHVAIERQRGSATIRIDSILREPKKEQAWMTWEIPDRPAPLRRRRRHQQHDSRLLPRDAALPGL